MRRLWLTAALLGCGDGAGEGTDGAIADAAADAMHDMGAIDAMDAIDDVGVDDAAADAFVADDAFADAMPDAMPEAIPDATPNPIDAAPPDDCAVALVAARVDGGPLTPLAFPPAAADGPAVDVALTLRNTCARRLRFLGHPDEWLTGDGFALDRLPPIALDAGAETTLSLRFTPGAAGEAAGRLVLPYDRPGAPLAIELEATVARPRALVFVGDGRHVVATADYGESVAADTFETLEPHGDALQRGVCWGDGRFVAVGGNVDRRWWTSADGLAWTAHTAPGAPIAGCAFGGGRFVAAAGRPLSSPDGIEWLDGRDDGFDANHLRAITYADGLFVAVGDGGRIATTRDGAGWERDDTVAVPGFTAVVGGGGRFVAVGVDGWTAASVDDGATWQLGRVAGAGRLGGVAYAGGRFVTGDGARVHDSADGVVWSPLNAADVMPRIGYGRWIFGASGRALSRSADGGFSWQVWHVSVDGLGVGAGAVEGL
ncbi:MAG: hypothetical protein H6705_19700 [Myxococcales bacterium]|nr:hypothetical protein [Myxococcales bacterium]